MTTFLIFLTQFGTWWIIFWMAFLLVLVLVVRGKWREAITFYFGLIATEATVYLMKLYVARPRPEDALISEYGYSFPSGHSALAAFFYGSLILLICDYDLSKRGRIISFATLVALMIGIGLSRYYLNVHYSTDILAGYIIGFFWLFIGQKFSRVFW